MHLQQQSWMQQVKLITVVQLSTEAEKNNMHADCLSRHHVYEISVFPMYFKAIRQGTVNSEFSASHYFREICEVS